jgi:hypothetical protein
MKTEKLTIRKQLCPECLKKYNAFESSRRQKQRLKIKLLNQQVSGKVKIKNHG